MEEDMLEACSDAETKAPFMTLSNYQIKDENNKYVSFAALPIQWAEEHDEDCDVSKEQVILHGFTAKGLEEILMPVMAWRFDLSHAKPEIYLQSSTDKRWIKLQKPPRHGYKDTIRNVLVAVHFLHYIKKNPEAPSDSVLDRLFKDKELSSYRLQRLLKDLVGQITLIHEASERLAGLSNAEPVFEDLRMRLDKLIDDDKVAMKYMKHKAYQFSAAIGHEPYSSLCVLCDEVDPDFHCEGPCKRQFHSYSHTNIEYLSHNPNPAFYCKNCEYKQHQCFACGELGSSDQVKGAEVIQCDYRDCYYFYHPHCAAKLLPKGQKESVNIAGAKHFICPAHYCCVCKRMEDTTDHNLHFAMCGRCPTSYHRVCLPTEICFAGISGYGGMIRTWDGFLPYNRVFMYCLEHVMNEETASPALDIRFPEVEEPETEERR